MKTVKNTSGFTLIEMAVVLAIIAVALGSGLLVFNEYMKYSKIKETKARMEEVLVAIKRFANHHQFLPCPADPTIKLTSKDFGKADCSSVNLEESSDPSNKVKMGGIPVSDLNIYPTLGLDAFGNRISYIIREGVADISGGGINAPGIDLDICNYSGSACYSNVIVILLSHGENAYGAWTSSGVRLNPTGGNDKEDENASANSGFYVSSPVANYDDLVYFRTTYQITDEDFE